MSQAAGERGRGTAEEEEEGAAGMTMRYCDFFAFLKGDLSRDLPPDGAGDLPLAAVHHAGRAEPGRSPAAASGAVSHLPSEAAARRGLQTHRALQGERQSHQPFLEHGDTVGSRAAHPRPQH